MAYMTVKDPVLAQGFAGIIDALTGNPQAAIEADLARGKRDLLSAQTAVEHAKAYQINAQQDALTELQSILTDPTLSATPDGRARLMSTLAGVEDGLKLGPSFATGATVFVNPQQFGPEDLSNILLGTGVVKGFEDTPAGLDRKLANDLEQERIRQAGALQRAQLPGAARATTTTPPLVSPTMLDDFGELVTSALDTKFPGAAVDPALQEAILTRAAHYYQQTRNAQLALQMALQDIPMAVEGKDNGWFGLGISPNPGTVRMVGDPPGLPAMPAVPAPAEAPAAAAAAAPVVQDQPPVPGTSPAAPSPDAPTGAIPASALRSIRVVSDGNGGWLQQVGDQVVPIKNGQTAVSPSTGLRLVFKDGYWYPVQ